MARETTRSCSTCASLAHGAFARHAVTWARGITPRPRPSRSPLRASGQPFSPAGTSGQRAAARDELAPPRSSRRGRRRSRQRRRARAGSRAVAPWTRRLPLSRHRRGGTRPAARRARQHRGDVTEVAGRRQVAKEVERSRLRRRDVIAPVSVLTDIVRVRSRWRFLKNGSARGRRPRTAAARPSRPGTPAAADARRRGERRRSTAPRSTAGRGTSSAGR